MIVCLFGWLHDSLLAVGSSVDDLMVRLVVFSPVCLNGCVVDRVSACLVDLLMFRLVDCFILFACLILDWTILACPRCCLFGSLNNCSSACSIVWLAA